MKKIIIIVAIIAGIYHFKPELFSTGADISTAGTTGDVELFTYTDCGSYCRDAIDVLKRKNIAFTHYDIQADKAAEAYWKKRGGGQRFPTMFIGEDRVTEGFYRTQFTHALAKRFGVAMLDRDQRSVVQNQLATYGHEKVVMYGTSWCPYCKKARAFFAKQGIDYVEIDVEKSAQGKRDYQRLDSSGYPLIYAGLNRFQGFGPKVERALKSL